jgi:hypothetical protein
MIWGMRKPLRFTLTRTRRKILEALRDAESPLPETDIPGVAYERRDIDELLADDLIHTSGQGDVGITTDGLAALKE